MVTRVMIVDDNAAIRHALSELFTREGDFDICAEAQDGRDAIEKARQRRPDLIITDLSMPVMNGLEETRILKRLMPTVPVIIFTVGPSGAKEALVAGADAVVLKSESPAVLLEKARALLDQVAA